jgi:hypothetical protein
MAKYPGAVEFISVPVCDGYSWQNRSIEQVACVYYKNMLRIQSLGRLPILLSGFSWQYATYEMVSRNELQLTNDDIRLDPESKLFDPALYFLKEEVRKQHQLEWFAKSRVGLAKNGMDIGEDVLSMFASAKNSELSEGLEAVLIGMVTGMWTTFEVMVEDLWKAAVKERPALHQGWTKKEEDTSGFRSIRKIKKMYEFTFRHDACAIHDTIGDERLEGLALTRNLLIHKLGIIDAEFDGKRDKAKQPPIPSLACFDHHQLHQTIEISGAIVKHLINPIPVLGLDLISHVDQWITDHP